MKYKYNVHGRITVIKPSTKSMTPIRTKWINPKTHRWQMCHRQLWDLGNGGCFHSGLRVWLICPSAALHSYCYVFLNHCKYRYSIYIYMYCRYIFICSYIRSLHTLKSWPLEGWKLLFWHEILARRFVRERERERESLFVSPCFQVICRSSSTVAHNQGSQIWNHVLYPNHLSIWVMNLTCHKHFLSGIPLWHPRSLST